MDYCSSLESLEALIILFFKCKDRTTKPNYRILIIVLAASDLCSSLYNTIFFQIPIELQEFKIPWYLGEFSCQYSAIISFSFTVASGNILCLMVAIRYRQLAYPFAEPIKKRYLIIGLLAGLTVSFGTTLIVQTPMTLNHGFCTFDFGGNFNDSKVRDRFYHDTAVTSFVTISIQIFLPLLIVLYITFLTSRIVHLRKKVHLQRNLQFKMADKKTHRLIWLTVIVYFSMAILPALFSITQGILMIKAQAFVNENLKYFMVIGFYLYLLLLSNSIANCFLYAGRVKAFRKFVKRLLCPCIQHKATYRLESLTSSSTNANSSIEMGNYNSGVNQSISMATFPCYGSQRTK